MEGSRRRRRTQGARRSARRPAGLPTKLPFGLQLDTALTVGVALVVLACLGVVLALPMGTVATDPTAASSAAGADAAAAIGQQAAREDRRATGALTPGSVGLGLAAQAEAKAEQMVCRSRTSRVPITAVSYNIKSGLLGGIGAILANLKRFAPDVVLLQEVDRGRHGTGRVDQAAWLAEQLGGWHSAFGANDLHGSDGASGTAILSRYPIISTDNQFLPRGDSHNRALLHAVVKVKGVEVSLYSTHLTTGAGGPRLAQAQRVAQLIAPDPRPKLVGGDMNTWPNSAPEGALLSVTDDTWDAVGSGGGATHPARAPHTRIDYLLYDGPDLTPTSAEVRYEGGSDHLAVRATYELGGIAVSKCRVGP